MHWNGKYATDDDLVSAWRRMQHPDRSELMATTYTCVSIIRFYLGPTWVQKHVLEDRYGFLSAHYRTLPGRDPAASLNQSLHVIKLGEMLYNFQSASGFREVLGLLEGGQIESTYGLLEIAMLIQCSGSHVAFHVPTGIKSHDYDLEATLPTGRVVCVEAKTRIDDPKSTPASIRTTLSKARKQLPTDGAGGAIFVRVPDTWIGQNFINGTFKHEVTRLLRNTDRVSNVVAVSQELLTSPNKTEIVTPVLACELLNDRLVGTDRSPVKLVATTVISDRWTWVSGLFGGPRIPAEVREHMRTELTKLLGAAGGDQRA